MAKEFNPVDDLRLALLDEVRCLGHGELARSRSIEEAELWHETIQGCAEHNRLEHYRWFGRNDLYFLLVYMLNCGFLKRQWYFDRCEEYQLEPTGCLDLWSRGSGKSVIGTFGANIQAILNDPNVTIGIFSHTKPIARQFLRQIKFEFESNTLLKTVYPDILWQDPKKESPKWSEDEGIIVKRTANPKEATVEAYGLTDGQPTSKHFGLLDYDDIIDEKAVTTPDQIDKVTKAWELSLNLRATDPIRYRIKGTFYAVGDTYHTMIERGFGKLRVRPVVIGDHSPLLSAESIAMLKQSMSPATWAMQILLDPTQADKEKGFKKEWLRHWKAMPSWKSMNRYIFVDPGGKGESSTSYTAMVVVGLAPDRHIYVLDMLKDRLSLVQRIDTLFELHRKYEPIGVYYERYSMQADIEFANDKQSRENYRFLIHEVGAKSGGPQLDKDKRIEKLQPDFARGLVLLPPLGSCSRKMHDGKQADMVENFINKEFNPFPYSRDKDFLDALARIHDPSVNLIYPKAYGSMDAHRMDYMSARGGSWMAE